MSTNKLKLNPDKTEFLLIGNERQRNKYLSMFPIELLGVETYPAKSAHNLGVIFDKNFNFRSHISAAYAVPVFTTSEIFGVFAVTLIWIVQNCLRMLWCLAVLTTVIHFCLGLRKLTSPSSNVFWTIWLVWSESHHQWLAVFHCCAPFIGYQ